jgi:hypothetical protein
MSIRPPRNLAQNTQPFQASILLGNYQEYQKYLKAKVNSDLLYNNLITRNAICQSYFTFIYNEFGSVTTNG